MKLTFRIALFASLCVFYIISIFGYIGLGSDITSDNFLNAGRF